jgi:hypothetical protein
MGIARVLSSTTALLLASSLVAGTAAGATRSGSYSQSHGNTAVGGTISIRGSMSNSTTSATASGRVSGFVRLFGYSREAGSIEARATQSTRSGSGSITLRIGNVTIWTRSLAVSGSTSFSAYRDVFTPDPRATYWVGPVPVTASGNVGAGADLTLSWTLDAPSLSAGFAGSAGAFGHGRASASLGVPGYNVTLQFTSQFANHQLLYGMTANRYGLYGYLGYNLNPIVLSLDLIVRFWPWEWPRNLVTYSFPPLYRSIL